jgi:hypothetical protein
VRTSQETSKVLPALFEVKKKMRPMVKDSANPFFKSKYLELSDILANLEPLLHEQDLFLTQGTLMREDKAVVVSRITHAKSGEFIESEFPAETATTDPQKLGSAVSYARRYGLQALVALNSVDDDGNSASGKGDKPAAPRASGFNKAAPASEKAAESADKSAETPAAPARRGSFGSR